MSRTRALFPLLTSLAAALPAQDLYEPSVVRTLRITAPQPDWWNQLVQNRTTGTDLPVDLTVDGRTYARVGLRFRGTSSYLGTGSSPKKSFNVTLDAFTPGQDLLGYTNLNLSNAYVDPTFTREVVSYEVLRRYMPAPKANYVRLYINDESWGVYVNVQQPDATMIAEWFRGSDGNRYRCDPPQASGQGRSALQWLGDDLNLYRAAYELKNENSPTGYVDLRELCNVLNNTPAAQLPQALPRILDVDRALWYLALNSAIVNLDCYIGRGNDYYLYADPWHGRFTMLPWDMNESFGGYNAGMTVAALKVLDIFWQETNAANRPLMARVLAVPAWRERYLAHYRTLLDEVFDWSWIGARVAFWQGLIEADVRADAKKLYDFAMFKGNLTTDYRLGSGLFQTWVPGLEPFVRERRAYLLGRSDLRRQAPALDQLAQSPAAPKGTDAVTVTVRASGAAAVALHARTTGPFVEAPMLDDGLHGDGAANDGVYGAALPALPGGTIVEYYATAAGAGGVRFVPSATEHAPRRYRVDWPRAASAVRLNELLARNVGGIVDEKGQHEDWIELWNAGAAEADLGGLHLTDDLAKPTKWRIPTGTRLPAGQTLLVWADEDPADGPLHANFKLGAAGEELGLFGADGATLLDAVAFGPQQTDVASGRLLDGGPDWVGLPAPTPRARNAAGACGVRSYTAVVPVTHGITGAVAGAPRLAATITLQVRRAPPNSAVVQLCSAAGTALPLPGLSITLLAAPPFAAALPLPTNANGAADLPLPIPDDARLLGAQLHVQAIGVEHGALRAGNATEITVCPK